MSAGVRRALTLGWCLALLAALGCHNAWHQPKLPYTPADPVFVPPGDGATVDRVVPLITGWARVNEAHFFAGGDAKGELRIPIPVFLIEHRGAYVLVDTGLHPALATRPADHLGERLTAIAADQLRTLEMKPGWDVLARLERMGIGRDRVTHVVLTHAHFDHTGANRFFPEATFVLTRAMLDAGRSNNLLAGYWGPDFPGAMKTYLIDFSHRRPFLTFAGSHDLFGDGAVVVLSMPGHDADNLGVFARTPQGPLLLAGDAAYTMRNIREMILPGYLADPCRAWDSLYRLKRLTERAPPIAVIPSHDPEAWKVIATPESQ